MKLKIKIIFSGNFPFGGAAANYVRNFAHCLSDASDVEVLLPKGYFFGDVLKKVEGRLNEFNGIKYRYLNHHVQPKGPLARIFGNLAGTIKLYHLLLKEGRQRKISIIFVYDIFLSLNFPLLLICRAYKIKLVNILPEFYPKAMQIGFAWISNLLFYGGIKYLVKYNNGVITLSSFLSTFVKQRGFQGELLLLPNIVDPDFFLRTMAPFKTQCFTIGYAGTPTVKDGIEDLMHSFALIQRGFPNTHLLIVGDTPRQSSISHLRNMAVELGINHAVTFSGLRSLAEVADLLCSCDILVLARPAGVQAEAGFPTKLGEYFSCRKPVVVTRVGDIGRYFAKGDVVQLVEPDDVESIANGIVELINSEQRRHMLADNGFAWMMQNLSIVSAKYKLEHFINRIVSERLAVVANR